MSHAHVSLARLARLPRLARLARLSRLATAAAVALACAVAIPATARAQGEPTARPRTVGVDAVVVLPLGDYGKVATLALGALARVEVPMSEKLSITGRAGALYHLLDSGVAGSLIFVPIYGGARYSLGAGADGPYVAGELGVTIAFASVDTGFGTASDSDSKLGGSLGAGLRRGALDVHAALFIPDLGHAGDPGLMGSVGYDFAAF